MLSKFLPADSLLVSFLKLYEKIRRSEQKYKVALEMLTYHARASDDEVERIKEIPEVEVPKSLTTYVPR